VNLVQHLGLANHPAAHAQPRPPLLLAAPTVRRRV